MQAVPAGRNYCSVQRLPASGPVIGRRTRRRFSVAHRRTSPNLRCGSARESPFSIRSAIEEYRLPVHSLHYVRRELSQLENSLVYNLHARSQLPLNAQAYVASPDAFNDKNGTSGSLLCQVMTEKEKLNASLMRYTQTPDHPFFYITNDFSWPGLPKSVSKINLNDGIFRYYVQSVLPSLPSSYISHNRVTSWCIDLTSEGCDGEYLRVVDYDQQCLANLSRRIHLGKYVAEAKFRENPLQYTKLIDAEDADALMELLTEKFVEEQVIDRVRIKGVYYEKLTGMPGCADYIADFYRDWIIPVTKDVEVAALLLRFK